MELHAREILRRERPDLLRDDVTWLHVPYYERHIAKARGARWSPAKRQWYAPGDIPLALFTRWLPDP
jgi:hypothetical protein